MFLSIFMSLWAVTFLEYWKRTCSALSHRWDCSDFQDIEVGPPNLSEMLNLNSCNLVWWKLVEVVACLQQERPRPEFTAMAPMTMKNPVTGAEEPYFPEHKRFNRTITGCMVIVIMVNLQSFII